MTMTFFDHFNTPSKNWLYGDVPQCKNDGSLVIYCPYDERNTVILSGMAVNPANFSRCRVRIAWDVKEMKDDKLGEMVIFLGMPFEWSAFSEALTSIHIDVRGVVKVLDSNEKVLLMYQMEGTDCGKFDLCFSTNGKELTIFGMDQKIAMQSDLVGFLGLKAVRNPVNLVSFEMESEGDAPPLTEEERQSGRIAWMNRRIEQNREYEKRLKSYLETNTQGSGRNSTDINVEPGMVRTGEKVTITFTCSGEVSVKTLPILEANYLGARYGTPQPIALEWIENGERAWTASVELRADRPGNWRIVWLAGGSRISRVFSVVEKGYAVCTLWIGLNKPDVDREIHKYDLPGDCWISDNPYASDPKSFLKAMDRIMENHHQYGDRLVPVVNADWILPGIPNQNLFAVDPGMQREGILRIKNLWEILGIGPLEILGSYTFGHETPKIAEDLGINAINSLCVWQNWLDGTDDNGWKINHWGAPNAPYYVAEDDLRKAGGPGIVAFSMGTASSVRNYCIYTMEGCPSLTNPMQRYTGETAQSTNMCRFYDAVDGWLYDAACQPEPVFFTAAIENFMSSPDWAGANEMAVDYLVKKAGSDRLVFASAADIAVFYRTHYAAQPQQVNFQPDVYCGYRYDSKPVCLPNRIEVSNANFHALFITGRVLPQFFWDFNAQWNETLWDNQVDLRNEFGLIVPDAVKASSSIPRQVDTSCVDAAVQISATEDGVLIEASVNSTVNYDRIPLAAWNIPLDSRDACVIEKSDNVTFTKIVDGFTGNIHGILTCNDVTSGTARYFVKLVGMRREALCSDYSIAPGIRARPIRSAAGTHTYMWREDGTPACERVISVPAGADAYVAYNDGRKAYPDLSGRITVHFGDDWRSETPVLWCFIQ